MAEQRMIKEFLACGFTGYIGMYEGVPRFSPVLSPENQAIANQLCNCHIDDDIQYMATDLRTDAGCLMLYGMLSPAQWDSFRNVQKQYIQYARRQRMRAPVTVDGYTPGDLKDKWLQTQAPEDRTAWLASLAAIVNALPFPSGQE